MTRYNDDFWKWVSEHRNTDPTKLRLNKKPDTPQWIDDAIAQIENEHRAHSKFAAAPSMLLPRLMPVGISIEQATSATIAQLHHDLADIKPGTEIHVLDMTCGLGIDASFISSDPSTKLTAIELDAKIAEIATYNFSSRPNIKVINTDSTRFLNETDHHFDLIFIDPARRDSTGSRVYNLHDCAPDVTTLLPLMRSKSSRIMIKMSPMLDVTQTLRDLPGTRQLFIVDERGECREMLAIIDSTGEPTIPIITIWHDGETFSFTRDEDMAATATTAMPAIGQYLLEPSPATMKAAPFKLLCQSFNASMIHPNTHLYTTGILPASFPGKVYIIKQILPFSSSNIKKVARQHINADVATRNFPLTADALRNRLGIKKSGDTRITGITACDGKQYLIFSERIEP